MKDHTAQLPRIVGTGLVALDIVYRNRATTPSHVATGGTCGNVLAILAYLGWRSVPLARLADDPARKRIVADLERWDVDTSFLSIGPVAGTPIVIENLTATEQGEVRHSFSWNCPCCGEWLPRYNPVPAKALRNLKGLPDAEIFFFDRASPGALEAATYYAERGALIVFEPAALGKPELFTRALELSHVVKYADNRMERLPVPTEKLPSLILEVQTCGHNGLRYRCALSARSKSVWHTLRAFHVPRVLDTVGCGDWCTAGLLSRIGSAGVSGLKSMKSKAVQDALQYGQLLAAWNCGFLGARGGMYERSVEQMNGDIEEIRNGRVTVLGPPAPTAKRAQTMSKICSACQASEERMVRWPA